MDCRLGEVQFLERETTGDPLTLAFERASGQFNSAWSIVLLGFADLTVWPEIETPPAAAQHRALAEARRESRRVLGRSKKKKTRRRNSFAGADSGSSASTPCDRPPPLATRGLGSEPGEDSRSRVRRHIPRTGTDLDAWTYPKWAHRDVHDLGQLEASGCTRSASRRNESTRRGSGRRGETSPLIHPSKSRRAPWGFAAQSRELSVRSPSSKEHFD